MLENQDEELICYENIVTSSQLLSTINTYILDIYSDIYLLFIFLKETADLF